MDCQRKLFEENSAPLRRSPWCVGESRLDSLVEWPVHCEVSTLVFRKPFWHKEILLVKLVVRDRESLQEAVRRFRKLVERSGIKKEMRRREFYEKPSETNRRARLRAERRSRRLRTVGQK